MDGKTYYHGRSPGARPYGGGYVYLTDSLEYASRYAGPDEQIYIFQIAFPPGRIFSIRNSEHLAILRSAIGDQAVQAAVRDSGEGELDWAASGYISANEFETAEDLLPHLGFDAVRLQERTGIESLLVFGEEKLEFIGWCSHK